MHQVVVSETSPLKAFVKPAPPLQVRDGDVLVHICKFVCTSNTITYALVGRSVLNTFVHYPTGDPNFASSPAWGIGVVVASRAGHIKVGTRIRGYFPMRCYCVLKPSKVIQNTFEDMAEHRSKTINAYRSYTIQDLFSASKADNEDLAVAGGSLYSTGFSASMQGEMKGATSVIYTSASSRTALTGAFAAKFNNLSFKRIGITSQRNLEFVKSTNYYNEVVTYDMVSTLRVLPNDKVAIYDMAGNVECNAELRKHFNRHIIDFSGVGKTHVSLYGPQVFGGGNKNLVAKYGGAKEESFLIFVALANAQKRYGKKKINKMLVESQNAYIEAELKNFKAKRVYGPVATKAVWDNTVNNTCDPDLTYVCSLWPNAQASEPKLNAASL